MNIAIEQIQHGNEQAFKSLFDEYYQGLCVFASAYLKDDDLSADVVQEAFVKFWNRRRDFDHIVKIKSFLYTIVRNDCLNIVQRQKVVLEDVSVFENSGFFHDKLIETESYRIFYAAIESLSPQGREVIQLALDGLKNSEIAARLGIAESSVHTQKKIAYKNLRVVLKDYYYLIYLFLG